MVRSFAETPVDPAVVDRIVLQALRSPTAGNAGGTAWVVLQGPEQTSIYFDATTDESWRSDHPRWHAGLSRAPVVLLAYACPGLYLDRYAERDKAASRLGEGPERWPVPYWTGDAAFGVMAVLLGAVDAGLGACVLGAFRGEDELARALAVPAGWQLFSAVVLGHPDGDDHRSTSLDRPLPPRSARLHRGRW
jgi:nitroreductase